MTQLAAGATQLNASAAGIQSAFLCGAVISLVGVVAAFFVRRPPELSESDEDLLDQEAGGAAQGVPIGH